MQAIKTAVLVALIAVATVSGFFLFALLGTVEVDNVWGAVRQCGICSLSLWASTSLLKKLFNEGWFGNEQR